MEEEDEKTLEGRGEKHRVRAICVLSQMPSEGSFLKQAREWHLCGLL
jgi:hypothetical protein